MNISLRRAKLACSVAFVGFSLSGSAHAAVSFEQNLATLESIAARSPNLGAFFQNRAARNEYELTLKRLYGRDRFPCARFDEVLELVRKWSAVDSSLGERLWRVRVSSGNKKKNASNGYAFVQAPRLFHALWDDLARTGCPDGSCQSGGIDTPGRWVLGLRGADFFFATKDQDFTGDAVWISEAITGSRKIRIAHPTSDFILTASGPRPSTTSPAARLFAVLGAGTSAYVVDRRAHKLRPLSELNRLTPLEGARFADTNASKFSSLTTASCAGGGSAAQPQREMASLPSGGVSGGAAAVGGNSAGETLSSGGGGATGSFQQIPVALAQAALGDVVVNLGVGTKKQNPADYKQYEMDLNRILKSDKDPERRAKAALGLGLLPKVATAGQGGAFFAGPSGTPTTRASWTPTSVSGLTSALDDPSLKVRGQAALALAELPVVPPPKPVNVSRGSIPKYGIIPMRKLRDAMDEAYRNANKLLVPGSPNLLRVTGPKVVEDRAFEGTLRNGLELKPETKRELLDQASGKPTSQTDPAATKDDRKEAIERIAEDYIYRNSNSTAMEAIERLRSDLQDRPELFHDVLAEVDRQVVAKCEDCNANPITR